MYKRFEFTKNKDGELAIIDNDRGYYATVNEHGASTILYWLNDLNE